jgi:hypothetical protein
LEKTDFLYDGDVGVNAIGNAIGNSIVADMRNQASNEQAFAEMANQNQERYVDEPGIAYLPGYEGSPDVLSRDPRVARSLLSRPMIDDQGRVIRGGELLPPDAEGMEAIPVLGRGTPGMERGPLAPPPLLAAPDSSDGYYGANALGAVANFWADNDVRDPRLPMVLDQLRQQSDVLQHVGDLYGIRPDFIAAPIAWEFTQNPTGYLSDLMGGTLQNPFTGDPLRNPFSGKIINDGYGWGESHYEALNEMFPSISVDTANALRNDLPSMIAVVGMRMADNRDLYFQKTAIDLSDNAPALAWLYNSSTESIKQSAFSKVDQISRNQIPALSIQNDMAYWVSKNIQQFNWVQPIRPLPTPVSPVPYVYTVSPKGK